jgi:hypothetical protein
MKITTKNVSAFGIGHGFTGEVSARDLGQITYGPDTDGEVQLTDPTGDGDTPYWKEYSADRWWKMGPRPAS